MGFSGLLIPKIVLSRFLILPQLQPRNSKFTREVGRINFFLKVSVENDGIFQIADFENIIK